MNGEVQNTEEIQEKLSVMQKIELYFLLVIVLIGFVFYLGFSALRAVESSHEEVKP